MVQHVLGGAAAVGAGDDPGGEEGGQEQQPGALVTGVGEIGQVMAGDDTGGRGDMMEGRRPGCGATRPSGARSCKNTVNDPD